jgi:TolB protein
MDVMPKFEDWMAIRAQVLVQATLSADGDNYRLQFYVWDINGKEQIEAQSLTADAGSVRRLGHIMSDAIYERLTGEGPYFDTQIAFITESGDLSNPTRRLAIMDSDGKGFRFISDDRNDVLTPHFSPNMQSLVFISYRGGNMNIWTLNMDNGEQRRLGQFPGMNFAPRYSPDGRKVALSITEDGTTNLWEYDIYARTMRRLTNTRGINTSPAYSPDGRTLIYNSDESGSQQLHSLDLKTLASRRISYGEGRYATPAFSPDGNFIAFTRMHRNTFFIGIMSPTGRNERTLASGWYMESPSWAPNSRRVVYYQTEVTDGGRGRNSTLRSVDILGHFNYEIKIPDGLSGTDPTWSPLLP